MIKVVKIGSIVLSVVGMIGSAWANDKENKLALAKLVADTVKK